MANVEFYPTAWRLDAEMVVTDGGGDALELLDAVEADL